MDWDALGTFIDKYGLPMVALVVGGWVVYQMFSKAIWPYFLTTQEQARADRVQERTDRITERDLFLASLGSLNATMISRDAMLRDNMSELLKALKSVGAEMRKSNTRVRRGDKEQQ